MDTILRAAAAYWFLLFMLRFVGRHAVSQMTPFELILIFLFGGTTIQAIVSDDRSITNAFLAVMTIGLMHILVTSLKQRSGKFGRVIDGTPMIVVENGEYDKEQLRKLQLQYQDILAAARQKGLKNIQQIKYAIVERNGKISIFPEDG
ncbi:MAG: DUF421 domain-containing protein [Chroococcidiopsidaceae cyanobacterium CP_BM_ER_R8_30]|nr:DUF421 domain-containing protein [Chroococcidiopsidaceae cyanobacterium CP_BM_ER_R8_30]